MAEKANPIGAKLAKKYIITLGTITALVVILSFLELTHLFNDVYNAIYYVLNYFFDAEGIFPPLTIIPLKSGFFAFSFVLLITGIMRMTIIAALIAIIIDIISTKDVRKVLSKFEAKRLNGHIVICGYSNFVEELTKDLQKSKKDFVIIDNNKINVDTARDLGYTAIEGDFRREVYLKLASIERASQIVLGSNDDFENILGLITAKGLKSNIKAIVKVNSEETVTKMLRAGADMCIVPEAIAGVYIGNEVVNYLKQK